MPYYFGDLKRDPNLENYPYAFPGFVCSVPLELRKLMEAEEDGYRGSLSSYRVSFGVWELMSFVPREPEAVGCSTTQILH